MAGGKTKLAQREKRGAYNMSKKETDKVFREANRLAEEKKKSHPVGKRTEMKDIKKIEKDVKKEARLETATSRVGNIKEKRNLGSVSAKKLKGDAENFVIEDIYPRQLVIVGLANTNAPPLYRGQMCFYDPTNTSTTGAAYSPIHVPNLLGLGQKAPLMTEFYERYKLKSFELMHEYAQGANTSNTQGNWVIAASIDPAYDMATGNYMTGTGSGTSFTGYVPRTFQQLNGVSHKWSGSFYQPKTSARIRITAEDQEEKYVYQSSPSLSATVYTGSTTPSLTPVNAPDSIVALRTSCLFSLSVAQAGMAAPASGNFDLFCGIFKYKAVFELKGQTMVNSQTFVGIANRIIANMRANERMINWTAQCIANQRVAVSATLGANPAPGAVQIVGRSGNVMDVKTDGSITVGGTFTPTGTQNVAIVDGGATGVSVNVNGSGGNLLQMGIQDNRSVFGTTVAANAGAAVSTGGGLVVAGTCDDGFGFPVYVNAAANSNRFSLTDNVNSKSFPVSTMIQTAGDVSGGGTIRQQAYMSGILTGQPYYPLNQMCALSANAATATVVVPQPISGVNPYIGGTSTSLKLATRDYTRSVLGVGLVAATRDDDTGSGTGDKGTVGIAGFDNTNPSTWGGTFKAPDTAAGSISASALILANDGKAAFGTTVKQESDGKIASSNYGTAVGGAAGAVATALTSSGQGSSFISGADSLVNLGTNLKNDFTSPAKVVICSVSGGNTVSVASGRLSAITTVQDPLTSVEANVTSDGYLKGISCLTNRLGTNDVVVSAGGSLNTITGTVTGGALGVTEQKKPADAKAKVEDFSNSKTAADIVEVPFNKEDEKLVSEIVNPAMQAEAISKLSQEIEKEYSKVIFKPKNALDEGSNSYTVGRISYLRRLRDKVKSIIIKEGWFTNSVSSK